MKNQTASTLNTLIGLIAAVITIFVFVTGYQSISSMSKALEPSLPPTAVTTGTGAPTKAPERTIRVATTSPSPMPISKPTTVLVRENGNDLILTLESGVTIDLVRIPAGEFLMGSTDSDTQASSDEKPQHKVVLDEYLIGKYDVTNAQFAAFVKATGYKTSAEGVGGGIVDTGSSLIPTIGAIWQHPNGPNSDLSGKDNHPVVQVSWDDAVAFCAWASQVTGHKVTLPTKAQWEKAARGTDGRIYPWGNDAPNPTLLNFNMNVRDTTEVGKYSPMGDSPYRLADMAGNVFQWTADWYGDKLVKRGGGWDSDQELVRAACRAPSIQDLAVNSFGFRVAVSAPVP